MARVRNERTDKGLRPQRTKQLVALASPARTHTPSISSRGARHRRLAGRQLLERWAAEGPTRSTRCSADDCQYKRVEAGLAAGLLTRVRGRGGAESQRELRRKRRQEVRILDGDRPRMASAGADRLLHARTPIACARTDRCWPPGKATTTRIGITAQRPSDAKRGGRAWRAEGRESARMPGAESPR